MKLADFGLAVEAMDGKHYYGQPHLIIIVCTCTCTLYMYVCRWGLMEGNGVYYDNI